MIHKERPMSTLEEHREFGEHGDASGLTVREAHHAVCAARMTHCRHGRARLVHGGRRTRRRNVSNRRAAMLPRGGTESARTLQQTHTQPIRRFLLVVVTVTVAVGMVFVGFMPVFEAGTNDRVLVVGVYLIVVAGAVCLNAITVEALYQPGRDPGASHPSRLRQPR
jgi:hypothetical protein